jgi:hypothetical protein
VTAHKQPPVLTERVLRRAQANPDVIREDTSYLVYIVLDELLAYYEGLSEHVEDELEVMQERALVEGGDEYLRELLTLRQYLFALARLADQQRDGRPGRRRLRRAGRRRDARLRARQPGDRPVAVRPEGLAHAPTSRRQPLK